MKMLILAQLEKLQLDLGVNKVVNSEQVRRVIRALLANTKTTENFT